MKNISMLLILVLSGFLTFSQDTGFTVFYLEGNSFITEQARGGEETMAMGKLIPPGGNIRLTEDSKVILFGESGDMIYLEEMGSYSYDTLQQIQGSDQSVMSAYLEFIWQELQTHHPDLEQYAEDNLRDKGGVTRSGCSPPEMLEPPYSAAVDGNNVEFRFKKESAGEYKVVILNKAINGTELYNITTDKEKVYMSTSQSWLSPGVTYYWSAYPVATPNCATFEFTYMTLQQVRDKETEINDMLATLNLNDGIKHIIRASFYEDNKMYNKARAAYEDAIRTEPRNEGFRNSYGLFLARIGLVDEAAQYLAD